MKVQTFVFGFLLVTGYDFVNGISTKESESCYSSSLTLDISKNLTESLAAEGLLKKEELGAVLGKIERHIKQHGLLKYKPCFQESDQEHNCPMECPSVETLFARYSEGPGVNYSQLPAAVEEAVFSAVNPRCIPQEAEHRKLKPTLGQACGYGIGFIAAICLISNLGGLLAPLISRSFFQRILQFLVAMGAGTLVATGLLVLIPEAFHMELCEVIGDDYIWKAVTSVATIYTFFVLERLLKMLVSSRQKKRQFMLEVSTATGESEKPILSSAETEHGHSHANPVKSSKGVKSPVASLAWVLLVGDAVHKFVDGLAIGAAFTENLYAGVSISLAVIFEEFPHELGDVAILLHSGMSMKRALLLNTLTACGGFVGLFIGIILGESTQANRWILGVAAGLFLYVPLVDMLPEMSHTLDIKLRESSREGHILFVCQSLGLLFGITVIAIVVNFLGNIQI